MRVFVVEAARRGKPGGSSLGGKLLRGAVHALTGSPKQSGVCRAERLLRPEPEAAPLKSSHLRLPRRWECLQLTTEGGWYRLPPSSSRARRLAPAARRSHFL